jgi:hypothetical protein
MDFTPSACGSDTPTSRYLNVKDDYLHELNERVPLTIVKG